ncbi:putative uncharacterized protein C7orf78 homolog isoform X2 [Oryctolagus cuniculus]|nr:uncharacterized protein LOC103349458 isoform X2 [Oryctolagus cuniculus]
MNAESPGGERDRNTARRLQRPPQRDHNSKWGKNVPKPPQSAKKVDIWEIQPPDFSHKLYTYSTFPEIPSRTIKEERRRNQSTFPESRLQLPSIKTCPKKATSPKFVTTFPRQDLQKTKLLCVKNGKYPPGVHIHPKPQEFRQHQPELLNFVTTYERDPFGLKLKSQLLSTAQVTSQRLKDDKQKNRRERFITHKSPECTWDTKLILSKSPWPVKAASYTRHRRWRDACSAFIERVEEKLAKTCKSR